MCTSSLQREVSEDDCISAAISNTPRVVLCSPTTTLLYQYLNSRCVVIMIHPHLDSTAMCPNVHNMLSSANPPFQAKPQFLSLEVRKWWREEHSPLYLWFEL